MADSEKESAGIGKGTPGPGRKKGVPNRVNGEVKAMILEALDGAGGVQYLIERASDPRTASAFLTLVGKVLPMQVQGDPDNPLQHVVKVHEIRLVPLKGDEQH